jgi:hypothetical protein
VDWPPSPADLYLRDHGPARAIFQGDIYRDVPFTKAGAGNDPPESEPALSASKRRHVATVLHPCVIVDRDNVTPINAQPVVAVYDAAKNGLHIRDDWEGVPFDVCPLPDLEGDGRMWVADFHTLTTVHRSYLPAGRRVRCLSELGWAVFRQRYIRSVTRGEFALERLMEIGRAAWVESVMETYWMRSLDDEDARYAFHGWLDAPDTRGLYVDRRRAIAAGAEEAIWEELRDELGTDP